MASRSIVSTTLAYTGGYIFLVLLAVCLATGTFTLPLSRSLSPCNYKYWFSSYTKRWRRVFFSDDDELVTLSHTHTPRVFIIAPLTQQVCITSRKWSKSTRVLLKNSSKTRSKSPFSYTCFYFSSTACPSRRVSWGVHHKSRIRDYSRDIRLLKCKR